MTCPTLAYTAGAAAAQSCYLGAWDSSHLKCPGQSCDPPESLVTPRGETSPISAVGPMGSSHTVSKVSPQGTKATWADPAPALSLGQRKENQGYVESGNQTLI